MVVQHNLIAMNANRMLNGVTKNQGKSTEKLSSGYRINRAADDAAGLSISEKMRKQIRGLTQASANAQDGISTVQTAEGALSEVQDMLQRMNELAVKAANGTNSEDDRTYIQNEVDQLVAEIDRVAETTKFNETYLLKGDENGTKQVIIPQIPIETFGGYASTTYEMEQNNYGCGYAVNAIGTLSTEEVNTLLHDVMERGISFDIKGDGTGAFLSSNYKLEGYTCVFNRYDPVTKLAFVDIYDDSGKQLAVIHGGCTSPAIGADVSVFLKPDSYNPFLGVEEPIVYDANGNRIPHNAYSDYVEFDGTDCKMKPGKTFYNKYGVAYDLTGPEEAMRLPKYMNQLFSHEETTGDLSLKIHVGADATSNNQIEIKIETLTAKGLGVDPLHVDGADETNALYAIEVVKTAIQKVSTQRSALGAIQNRLDHTINNLDNVVENTTAAEASIRDTDMAAEMVRFSNNNILAQAGQAMLAQANQSNQGALSLLQ